MSDRQALIEAIRANPDEDTPRLILADWFEENGDAARGEFIRVQCELARTDPISDRYPDLYLRQLQLLAECERDWLGEWSERLVRWEFRRGMLEDVTIRPEPYCAAGGELFREHPVSRVAFVDVQGEALSPTAIRDVLTRPHSRYLRAIDAAGCKTGEQADAMFGGRIHTNSWLTELARATSLDGLRELSLFGGTREGRQRIDPLAWQEFCAAEHLRDLTHLDISNCYDAPSRSADWEPVIRYLTAAGFAPKLQSLQCELCHIGSESLSYLTRSRRFTSLRSLAIGGVSVELAEVLDPGLLPALRDLTVPFGAHVATVVGHPGWGRMERIGFVGDVDPRARDGGRDATTWREFCRSPHVKPIACLVYHYDFDPARIGFWDELVGAPWFGNLTELALHLPDYCCAPLFERALERFPRLHTLRVNPSTDLVERLAAWPGLANLVELGLGDSDNSTDLEAAVKLFTSSHLTPRLRRLRVSGLCRSPGAVAALANCPALVGLQHLDFAFNELSPESAAEMAASPHLRNLRSLHTWSEWDGDPTDEAGTAPAWLVLADPRAFPQLRDIVVGSGTPAAMQDELRRRFGPRLRVFADC